MCGIVGYVGEKNSPEVLIDGLKKLEYRGYDSAGIAFFEENEINIIKSRGKLQNLINKINENKKIHSTCGIGHTRWATHGEPSHINSHPHGSKTLAIVHNGIIENYLPLKEELLSKGYNFLSQTDSEVLALLLDYYYEKDPIFAVNKMVEKIKGSYALGIIFRDYPEKIFAVKRDSPLIIGKGKGENFIASDIPAILKYTNKYIILEEGEIAEITKECIRIYNRDNQLIEKEILTATWDENAAEKNGFPHFMLKEIYEEGEILRKTISPYYDGNINFKFQNITDENINSIKKIHIIGCGTAMHAGLIGKNIIEKLCKIPVEVHIASEFRYSETVIDKQDLILAISQSGETADTIAALKKAGDYGCRTIAVVNVLGSSITRISDDVIYTFAGPEISVASTKAYLVQIAIMYLLALKISEIKNLISENEIAENISYMLSLEKKINQILNNSDKIKHFAYDFHGYENLFYIGRGLDYSIAAEASLKLKEISYIHSETYAAGELKHGAISLITKDFPVIALATDENLFDKMLSNIKEIKSRGGKVLLITTENIAKEKLSDRKEDIADYIFQIPETKHLFIPFVAIIPLQLFAYYMAVLRGCDVDKPRNLAKSVTVE
ncbi:MAG: glutamine--fructose-6-phosphate transaminase (isomerizing) [Clostridia bacterium]|nr:glutamine--fructose-6-phosphate transaminase (isomerizing) [Clostridia bacterium]